MPGWVGFVKPIVADSLDDVRSSSASALLLRVALNRVDPAQLRSLDTKSFEDVVLTTAKQVSRNAELPAFGVDVSRDRATTGVPRDKAAFAKRLSGSDALVLNLETAAADLGNLCGELLTTYGKSTYKADFGWVDHLTLVQDAVDVDALDAALVQELTDAGSVSTHMAVPEPINWEELDAFKIVGTRALAYDDLDLEEYLANLPDRSSLTLADLKRRRVSVGFARTDRFEPRWSLYNCLVSESNGALLCLDAKIKRPGGAASGIELCDLLSTTASSFTSSGDLAPRRSATSSRKAACPRPPSSGTGPSENRFEP